MSFGEYIKNASTKAYYSFNTDLTTDLSGNGNTLTNSGVVTLTNLGKFNAGADFGTTENNGKRLYRESNLGASLSTDITILFWVNIKTQPTAGNKRFIDYRTGAAYLLVNYEAVPTRQVRISCNGTDAVLVGELPLNVWYLFGVSISTAGVVSFYLNGTLRATGTRTAAAVGNTFDLGNCLRPANFNLGAIYDEVIIEQRLWTAQEHQKFYTNGLGRF